MSVAYNVSGAASINAREPLWRAPVRMLRLALLPLSLALWAIGVSETKTDNLGLYGLPAALPLIFYAGLAGLIVSAGIEFSRPRLSELRLALHAVALVVILYGTAPLVYKEGRYSWLYKTIGVVQYVSAHGSLDRSIDIYQNWPGFFALAAWFDKVAGAGSPLDYAKWAQLAFELAAIPLLYTIYRDLGLPVWHRWLAIMLYAASNWIAQDYFSPQGMSTLLSLGVMAVVARWMLVVSSDGRRHRGDGSSNDSHLEPRRLGALATEPRRSGPFLLILIFLFAVLTASHELSPYIVIIQIASLAIVGLGRPRLVALALAVIAIAYLLPNFSYVNSHYGLTSSIGSFFSNVKPPASSYGAAVPESLKIIEYCSVLLSVFIWLLALAGAWLRRNSSRRLVLVLLLPTCTPVFVLVAGAYGNEGLLRVYLFSLPWAVALAVYALAPRQDRDERAGHGALRAVVPLALAITLFFPSFFGNDGANVMTPSEVNTALAFFQSAKPGAVLAVLGNAPASDTADYNKLPVGALLDAGGIVPGNQVIPDVPGYVARTMEHYYPGEPAYIVMTPSMTAYNKAYGVTAPKNITTLLAELAKSPYWTLAASNDGTLIYQLAPAAGAMPSGSYSTNVVLGVPLTPSTSPRRAAASPRRSWLQGAGCGF